MCHQFVRNGNKWIVDIARQREGSGAQLSGGYPLLSPQLPKKGAGDENSP
jgi:hypothetical protein